MDIIVSGLGHIGLVMAACLLEDGHSVTGVDTNPETSALVSTGRSPISEPQVGALLAAGHRAGLLRVAGGPESASRADIAFVCVGTDGLPDGGLDLGDCIGAARALGLAIRQRPVDDPPMLVVFRSTMPPGSMTQHILPALAEAAGSASGTTFDVAYNPEFGREGSAVSDYYAPARTIIGERVPGCADRLAELYAGIDAPVFRTGFATAEFAKLADNGFHALKIAYANELGRTAMASGLDPAEIFEIFVADNKLNISTAYLRPGSPFGGPCLTKDVSALCGHMGGIGIEGPVLSSITGSNNSHSEFLVAEIGRRAVPGARILMMGLTFKPGSDDLRGSPFVTLAGRLLDRGYDLAAYDPDLAPDHPGAGLPPALHGRVLWTAPGPDDGFDLVVVGKSVPDVLRGLAARAPVLRIDRL